MTSEQYSDEGPICPYCLRQFTADDSSYYNDNLTELDCDDCERTFCVSVYTSTSWTTNAKDSPGISTPIRGA